MKVCGSTSAGPGSSLHRSPRVRFSPEPHGSFFISGGLTKLMFSALIPLGGAYEFEAFAPIDPSEHRGSGAGSGSRSAPHVLVQNDHGPASSGLGKEVLLQSGHPSLGGPGWPWLYHDDDHDVLPGRHPVRRPPLQGGAGVPRIYGRKDALPWEGCSTPRDFCSSRTE